MRIIRTICASLFLALISSSQSAWAENDSDRCNDRIVKTVGKHFALDDFSYPQEDWYPSVENGGLIIAGVCKPHPQNPQWVIAAFAYDEILEDYQKNNQDYAYGNYDKTFLLSVIDVSTNRIVASYKGSVSDGGGMEIRSSSLRIDTGRYNLSETTRAFGIRLVNTNAGLCGYDGGSDDYLTLFIMEGKTFKPVLSETTGSLATHAWVYFGNRCGWSDEVITERHVKTTISVEPTSTKGFADLRLVATRDDTKKSVSAIIKYNGKSYDLKPWEKAYSIFMEDVRHRPSCGSGGVGDC